MFLALYSSSLVFKDKIYALLPPNSRNLCLMVQPTEKAMICENSSNFSVCHHTWAEKKPYSYINKHCIKWLGVGKLVQGACRTVLLTCIAV